MLLQLFLELLVNPQFLDFKLSFFVVLLELQLLTFASQLTLKLLLDLILVFG